MDNNYEGRKSINLSKEKDGKQAVREAYPVYNNNPDASQLNQQEYRNQKATPSYQNNNSTSNYNQNQNQNQNLNHYYDYNDPQPMPTEDMYGQQGGQPPVHHLPNQQSSHTSRYVQRQEVYGEYIPPQQVVQMQPQQYPQQAPSKYCKYCGGRIPAAAVVCTLCGQQVEQLNMGGMPQQMMYRNDMPGAYPLVNVSSKSKTTAIVLAALGFIGVGGLHRLYSGKIVSGLLYLFTGGLCGIGTIVDLLKIASDTFTDGAGYIIKK